MQKRRILFLIVCLGLQAAIGLRATAVATAQGQASDVSFKTPEEAITLYMQGVAQNNISTIMQACAINEMSEKFRFDLGTARTGVLDPYQTQAPAEYPFYAEMNKEQLSAQILGQVRVFAYSLLSAEDVSKGMIIIIDGARTTKFIKDVNPKRLTQLEVKKIGIPSPTNMQSVKYMGAMTRLAQVYGANGYTERVVLFMFEGNYYGVSFSLFRYGDNWKIMRATAPLSGLPSNGATVKTTVNDFENLIR